MDKATTLQSVLCVAFHVMVW